MIAITNLTEKAREKLSEKRSKHSESTADVARNICRAYGLDPEKGYIGGLLHDIGRERPLDEIIRLAGHMYEITKEERNNPILLHGKAGSVIAKNELGIENEEILEAIAYHVTGAPGMGTPAKAVFAADYLEPGRHYRTEALRKQIGELSLDELLYQIMNNIFTYLQEQGETIATPALQLHREIEEKVRRFEKKEGI